MTIPEHMKYPTGAVVKYSPPLEVDARFMPVCWQYPPSKFGKRPDGTKPTPRIFGALQRDQCFVVLGMLGYSILAYIDGKMVEIVCPIDMVVVSEASE